MFESSQRISVIPGLPGGFVKFWLCYRVAPYASFLRLKFQNDLIATEEGVVIQRKSGILELLKIPALLQGSTKSIVSLVKKNQNDRIRTERGVVLQRNLEL